MSIVLIVTILILLCNVVPEIYIPLDACAKNDKPKKLTIFAYCMFTDKALSFKDGGDNIFN